MMPVSRAPLIASVLAFPPAKAITLSTALKSVLSDKCEPVSEWPVTVALCRTELAPLSESSASIELEIVS